MPTEPKYLKDILAWIPDHRKSFFLETTKIVNTYSPGAVDTAISIDDVIGTLVKDSGANVTPILDGDEANVGGVILRPVDGVPNNLALAANAVSTTEYFVIKRGPAELNESAFNLTDVGGDPIDIAAIRTALDAIDIKTVAEPAKTTTQST